MRFFFKEKLGPKRLVTPEGFLVCLDVPIARTGQQLYGPGETKIEPGPDGITYIDRLAEDVFRPETIASSNGKPVVNDHPPTDVNAENWKDYTVGFVSNPHRDDDLLVADFIVMDSDAIKDIDDGKREVSCGYDADYVQTGPGRGRQENIVINHVALVEAGRCGGRCSIGDKQIEEGAPMSWIAKIRTAFKDKNEAAFEAAVKEVPLTKDNEIHIHANPNEAESKAKDEAYEARFKALEDKDKAHDSRHGAHDEAIGGLEGRVKKMEDNSTIQPVMNSDAEVESELEMEAPEGTSKDALKGAKDSALLQDSFTDIIARAEILAPGIKVPTFDRAAKPVDMFRNMCGFRRDALAQFVADADMATVVKEMAGGKTVDATTLKTLPCGMVRDLFNSASAFKKLANNSSPTVDLRTLSAGSGVITAPTTIAELNKKYRDRYDKTV